ncbi:MAG: DUF4367 domain-containing protein [Chloroflexota bacterium]
MDDQMERWTVTAFDDASARIALPPRERWLPTDRRAPTSISTLALTFAVVAAIAVALWLVADGRIIPATSSARPTPTGLIRLAPGGTEAQTWGKVWSVSQGATVLRPVQTFVWVHTSDTSYDVTTSSNGLHRYVVGYYGKDDFPSLPRPWSLLFIGEGSDVLPPQLGPGESSENVTVRGQTGRLITAPDKSVRVVWNENGIRYTIQAKLGITASDVLGIAESLAPVVDANGNTR